MNNLKLLTKKMSVSLGLFAAVMFLPSAASADVKVSDNGAFSDNFVRYDVEKNVDVRQANDTNITNDVNVSNNTGNNKVYANNGGDVTIKTGDASANVSITNKAGSNVANISGCGSCGGNADLTIKDNGPFSDNTVKYSSDSNVYLDQRNYTNITNNVNVNNNTGNNTASGNNGGYWYPSDGDVKIKTGDANADVTINNAAGLNVANISGCGDCSGGADITISDNGKHSDNTVKYSNDNNKNVDQYNDSDFDNNVDVHNNTGYNSAGGDYWYPFHKNHDNWFDKEKYDFDKNHHHDYDKDKYDDHKDYGHDYDKDHHVKYYPVKYVKAYDCDNDWYKYHDNYKKWYEYCYVPVKHVVYKPVIVYKPVYVPVYHPVRKDYDHHDKKDYDKDYGYGKHVSYKPYKKYQPYVYYPVKKYHEAYKPYHPAFYGHGYSGGDVKIHTGDANAKVNVHNLASSNYLK